MSNKVALVVHSCDRYVFLYQGFETFFNRYWNFDVECNYYFATEEREANIRGFKNIRSGKGQWSDRLANIVHQLNEDYILYFQEDMWLTKGISATFFNELFTLVDQQQLQQVKLHSSDVYKTFETPMFVEGFNVGLLNNDTSDFLMSHQVTLWHKPFLLKQLPSGEHPWRNERKGSKRLRKLHAAIYQVDYFSENGSAVINNTNKDGFIQSDYRTVSINGTLHQPVLHFIPILLNGSEKDKEYAAALQHHLDNGLTHDGKPKPRKEDLFKKLKNWVKNR